MLIFPCQSTYTLFKTSVYDKDSIIVSLITEREIEPSEKWLTKTVFPKLDLSAYF